MNTKAHNRPNQVNLPFISISVVSDGAGAGDVCRTLRSMFRQKYPRHLYEVIVVHNGDPTPALWQPMDACCEMLGPNFSFTHFHRPEKGTARARDMARTQANPEARIHVSLLPGVELKSDSLRITAACFQHQQTGLVRMLDHEDQEFSTAVREDALRDCGGWTGVTESELEDAGWNSVLFIGDPATSGRRESAMPAGMILPLDQLPGNFRCRAIMAVSHPTLSWQIQ